MKLLRWALLLLVGCASPQGAGEAPLSVAVFESDATTPPGHPACGGWLLPPLNEVEAPLLLKGVVLSDGRTRYVLAALDWCRLHGGAYDLFRRKMAAAAGVPETQVAVQCTHAHDAPLADTRAQELLEPTPNPPPHLDLKFMAEVTDRAAAAVRGASRSVRPFTHVGYGRGLVEKFASNRRVLTAEGKVVARFSQVKDPAIRNAPEGAVDPWLKAVTLYDGARPVVRMLYYASHLQNNYGDGKADPDVAGQLRARLEKEGGVPHIYFAGCGGDVTVGKYADIPGNELRPLLLERLLAGARQAAAGEKRVPARGLRWGVVEARFAPRTEAEWAEETLRKTIADPAAPPVRRLKAALAVAWYERLRERPAVDFSGLRIGPVFILNLPGESFIEYQLYAAGLRPDAFVAVAANGEGGPGYICTDRAIAEGGYEPTMSLVGPPTEATYKRALSDLFRRLDPARNPFYPDRGKLLVAIDAAGRERAVRTPEDWAVRRAHVLANMQEVMGPLPDASRRVPLDVKESETVELEKVIRKKITYASEPGDRVSAYLLLPKGLKGRVPGILCPHPTNRKLGKGVVVGLGERPNRSYALELAERGCVTLAPDYPNSGDRAFPSYERGYASATMKAVWDHMRGVDLLQSLPEVDPAKIGAIGHSLGGHCSIFAAVFDARIGATVSCCGFTAFARYYGGNLAGWSHDGYMPRIASVYEKNPRLMPFDFHELVAAIAPRAFLAVAPEKDGNFDVTGVREVMEAARAVYELHGVPERLRALYPDCAHDFPDAARAEAYAWFDRWLGK